MRVLWVLFLLMALPQAGHAQEGQAAETPAPVAAAPKPADDPTFERRLALAKKMHEIRPTRDQVNAAIDQTAERQPEAEREAFKTAMRNVLNYKAIEKISIDSMVDTYTEEELQAMVDYNSKPEAQSAALKDGLYAQKIYPEIIRMLDQAMMRVRTGGPTGAP